MRASGWHGGGAVPSEPAGYGLKFEGRDRDKYFDRSWSTVIIELGAWVGTP
jgi:hypothetical protein